MVDRLYCRVPHDWLADPSACWFEWQTLVSGILAVAAALWAGRLLSKQIRQTEGHRQDEIERRHTAARATLPLALAKVSDITQQIADNIASEIEELYRDRKVSDDGGVFVMRLDRSSFEPVEIGDEIVKSFQGFIQTLNDKHEIRHMAELLSSLQIMLARYSSFDFKQAAVDNALHELFLDVGKVRLLNDRLYNYGRFVAEDSFAIVGMIGDDAAWDQLLGRAQGLVFHRDTPDLFLRKLKDKVDRYKESGVSPWNEKFGA
jgi:hypothetical protein